MNEHRQQLQQHTRSEGELEDQAHNRIRNYKSPSSGGWNHHVEHNSSQDPTIASTQAVKPVSNARTHPRASLKDSKTPPNSQESSKKAWDGSNHVHNHIHKESRASERGSITNKESRASEKGWEAKSCNSGSTNGKRQRSKDEEEDVWTEHISSSGRTYFYNKRLDKSQWERPKSSAKRARCNTPGRRASTASSTPASQARPPHHDKEKEGSGQRNAAHSHSRGDAHRDRESGRGLKQEWDGRDQSKHHADRVKGHESRHRQHKSRSHSGSSSPVGGGAKQHGSAKTHSSSGRSHGHATAERSHKTHSTSINSPAASTPKSSGIQLVSPTTPGSNLLTPTLPQTASSIVDHTSILLEQPKVLPGETTPTAGASAELTTPITTSSSVHVPVMTPSSHQVQPLAKKKLSLTPQPLATTQPPFTTPAQPGLASPYAISQGGVVFSPQVVDNSGLHPLQRALLLQNQKMQLQAHPLQQGIVETTLQTPPPATLPHHVNPHKSDPSIVQSPIPHTATPVYSIVQPMTPLQPNMFVMPAGTTPNFDPSVLPPQPHVLSSKALQKPMSKLAFLNNGPELFNFPNTGGLERVGSSQIKLDLVDKEAAQLWLQHNELLAKQVEQGRLETFKRRTVDSLFLSGKLAKKQLELAAAEAKMTSKTHRASHLQALLQELDRR